MVGRLNYNCGACGHTGFTATGIANDMPEGDSEHEWKFRLVFNCENCSQEVTEMITKMNGETGFSMNLNR